MVTVDFVAKLEAILHQTVSPITARSIVKSALGRINKGAADLTFDDQKRLVESAMTAVALFNTEADTTKLRLELERLLTQG